MHLPVKVHEHFSCLFVGLNVQFVLAGEEFVLRWEQGLTLHQQGLRWTRLTHFAFQHSVDAQAGLPADPYLFEPGVTSPEKQLIDVGSDELVFNGVGHFVNGLRHPQPHASAATAETQVVLRVKLNQDQKAGWWQ